MDDRLVEPSGAGQEEALIAVGLRAVGIHVDRSLELGQGLLEPALFGQGVAEIVVGVGLRRVQFDRPPIVPDRLVELIGVGQAPPRLLWAAA